jgi:hypothetical protein
MFGIGPEKKRKEKMARRTKVWCAVRPQGLSPFFASRACRRLTRSSITSDSRSESTMPSYFLGRVNCRIRVRSGRTHVTVSAVRATGASLLSMAADEIENAAIEELWSFPIGRMSGLSDDDDLVVWDMARDHSHDGRRRRRVGCAGHEQSRHF